MKLSVWSLACQQSVFQRCHGENIYQFYPQDGGEMASKLRHCHAMYSCGVSVSDTSRCSIERGGRIDLIFGMEAFFNQSYTAL